MLKVKRMKKVLFYAIVAMVLPVSCNSQAEQKTADAESEYANDAIAAIMERRSVRQYSDTPVSHDTLALIVQCGINAPSGMNQQPWEVRVVEDASFISETTELFKEANPEMVSKDANFKNMYRNAPNIIVVATPEGKGALDAGLLGENMAIAAKSLGLGTCFLGGPVGFLYTEAGKPYLEKLDLPEGYTISYILAIGYPEESPEAKPRDEGKVKYIK